MTRINLVPPSELYDQHLFAEFREIKMVPKALSRRINAHGFHGVLSRIPKEFTLGKGHVMFFYDKGRYLKFRYQSIREELDRRGICFNRESRLDPDLIFENPLFNKGYTPTNGALDLIQAKNREKTALKPDWYRMANGRFL